MSITEHLLANKILSLQGAFSNETAFQLYNDMTENAVFFGSLVSDQRGELHAKEDTPHNNTYNSARVSETAWYHSFTKQSQDTLDEIRDYVCDLLNVNADQFEPWQCTRYFKGGKFDYHDDCGNWASNERLYTVMYTLRAPNKGGETHFNRLGMTIKSASNMLLIWRNLNEDYLCDGMAQHAGMPVGDPNSDVPDEKMIVVTWIRRFKYEQ